MKPRSATHTRRPGLTARSAQRSNPPDRAFLLPAPGRCGAFRVQPDRSG